jgi:hypothetical protein
MKIIRNLVIAVVISALLAVAYFYIALNWSYSKGDRAGWLQKLSDKGWICKTWEGEMALVSLPGTSAIEKFAFTVRDDRVAAELAKQMGKRVTLHYEEKVGLPTSCFGDTRHYVTKVTVASDISLSPGVVVQTGTGEAAVPPVPSVPKKD